MRLGEFDMGGVLYHANYFHLYEIGREALLSSNSIAYSELAYNAKHLAIVESHQCFLAPVHYGMELEIAIWCSEIKKASVNMNYEIYEFKGENLVRQSPMHQAWTRHVFVDASSGKLSILQFPETLRSVFNKFLVDKK